MIMKERIETKWQYVARIYRETGDERRAGIADKIDELLATIPEYDRTTVDWDEDVASGLVDNTDIIDVVQCSCYCTACVHTDYCIGCEGCIFSERGGRELYFSLDLPREGDDI
jgi:hypothetical protein